MAGLDVRGEITHPATGELPCVLFAPDELCPIYAPMERGLFVDDRVISISSETLQVHALADLTAPIATVNLRSESEQ